ncbi:hypothetical protein [Spongiactinospora sp. TRM90649]|uniref:hypothetical protein n=1 Tax=Spongiactinospora sp. TRM90649 TaxID=3031114 RepID=UPI0023F9D99C|nr:hypothetical protein [Spongiactinospora sp. TRM90649]MDF5758222.1 hypothetical protein [Spongiactinospora sp. TRM90649]
MPSGFIPDGPWSWAATFLLATVSATVFLLLRCQRVGRPFGRTSRWTALAVIALTGVASTVVTVVVSTIVSATLQELIGLIVPCGIWLGHVRGAEDGKRGIAREVSTVWLSSLLKRLHQEMALDRERWCEARVDPSWDVHRLSMAAGHYHERIHRLLPPEERRQERVQARLQAIERRLDVAALIEDGASRSKIVGALNGSRDTKKVRYERYLGDMGRLHGVLRNDAEQELRRLLDVAYRRRIRALPLYRHPARDGQPMGTHP